jgi:hypothetical protein
MVISPWKVNYNGCFGIGVPGQRIPRHVPAWWGIFKYVKFQYNAFLHLTGHKAKDSLFSALKFC